jgi:EAL domain-containing protein (putative c-di-GMP-specific phosphodiesterase class I)/FixJ family two-component response regulator
VDIDLASLRILVVEDQGFQRWAVTRLLEQLGMKAIFAAVDGNEALELFRTSDPPIDIVVSDLNMPGMDGMEFIRHLGASGRPVSVIVASELDRALIASVGSMTQAYGIDLLAAIQKPVTAQKLEEALRSYRRKEGLGAVQEAPFSLDEILEAVRNDEFEPFFLPKMDIASQSLVGAEAVARWHHRDRGVVVPAAFIPRLEENAMIDGLTESIVRKAALACYTWRREGFSGNVSVNVSLASLTDLGLAERLTQIVREMGIDPQDVILEITETAAATHLGKVLENLSRLRMKGFGLAIDDYGTGYSSMQQLTQIPFTELKIDQSFVRNATTKRTSRAVVESSLEMASKLRIEAVAEGVETRDQLVLLRDLGCPLAQGYLIGKPMPGDDFRRFVAARR